jgi:hypothetical protein
MRARPLRRLTIAAIVVSLLAAACSGGTDDGNDPATQPGASSQAEQLTAPQDIEAAGAKALHDLGAADWLAMAAGSAWVSGLGDGRNEIGRLQGQTGKLLNKVTVPAPVCMGMDVGYGSVWAATCAPATVTRINAKTGKVQARVAVDAAGLVTESSLAAGEGGVWVLADDISRKQVVKIDPRSDKVVKTAPAPDEATNIRAGLGGLWVTAETGKLTRLDPGDLSTVAEIDLGPGAGFLAVGERAVWVLGASGGIVARVDPATNKVVARIKVANDPVGGGDIAVGGGSAWARVTDQLAVRIDPASNTVTARYGPPAGSGGVAADTTAAWLSAHDSQTLWRLPLS